MGIIFFRQEHISKFDDHFVLKHLPVFQQELGLTIHGFYMVLPSNMI